MGFILQSDKAPVFLYLYSTDKAPPQQKFAHLSKLLLGTNYISTSVCYKTNLITVGVGGAGAGPPTSKLGTFFMALGSKCAKL